MINNRKLEKGEIVYDRLFLYLLKKKGIEVGKVSRIRPHVLKLESKTGRYVMKRYKEKEKIIHTYNLLQEASKKSFTKSINFIPYPDGTLTFSYEGAYWALMNYREGRALNYYKRSERKEALSLLSSFHNSTKANNTYNLAPLLLEERWEKRLSYFEQNSTFLHQREREDILYDGAFLLGKIRETSLVHPSLQAINHGDVASHNFLKSADMVRLIDFDRVHYDSVFYDYLQLTRRFLCYTNASLTPLFLHNELLSWFREPRFLYALLYQDDLFKAWPKLLQKSNRNEIEKALILNKLRKRMLIPQIQFFLSGIR
ncbi:phosphotransferase [Priestia filamentosa]|uniref:phosphotransferase n=1 Tax=Priestia filamentosa TaxID=1402861 RepID=UPI002E21ACF1|nr:phosphotransferase [Priestia filamentosa]